MHTPCLLNPDSLRVGMTFSAALLNTVWTACLMLSMFASLV